jgi:putative endonuclease
MRTDRQQAGDDAEALVATHLERLGWTILARNAHAGRGELDLVAVDPGPPRELVIVEVRRRSSRAYGLAEETVDRRKRARLRAAIGRLLEVGLPGGAALPALPLRADLVVVEPDVPLRHHRAIAL